MGFWRLFLVSAVALAMMMAPTLALADDDDDDGSGGGGDRAFCAPAGPPEPEQCSIAGGANPFDFDASSGPRGKNPTGTIRFESAFSSFFFEGEITCLQVMGNRASFGGTITASSSEFLVGRGVALTVADNTPGAPDLISVGANFPTAPTPTTPNCGDPTEPSTEVTGDIVVQDRGRRR